MARTGTASSEEHASGAGREKPRWLGFFAVRRTVELPLDLAPIRRELGPKWDKVAPSVRRFASHVIERHIGKDADFDLSGDVFVIRFVGVRRSDAIATRRDIEADLRELLFGSGDVADPIAGGARRRDRTSRPVARRRRFAHWLAQLGRALSPHRLRAAFRARNDRHRRHPEHEMSQAMPAAPAPARAAGAGHGPMPSAVRPGTSPTHAPPGAPEPLPAAIPANGAEPARGSGSDWWRTNATPAPAQTGSASEGGMATAMAAGGGGRAAAQGGRATHDSSPEQAKDPTRGSSRVSGRVRRTNTDALERALFAAIQEAERRKELAQMARIFPPIGTRFLYRPMWLIERGVLPIYTCTAACALGPFEFVTGDALIAPNTGSRKIAMLDEMLMEHVANDLRTRKSAQLHSFVCIPVHFETLTGDRGHIWMEMLRSIPDRIRLNVMIEIVDIAQGVGQLSTLSLVRKLKGHVRDVVGRLELNDVNFRIWRETDLLCVGVDVETDNRPEADVISDLNNFAAPAKQHGLRTYARGLRTLSLAAAAVASGVDYLDGPAIDEGDFVLTTQPRPFGIFDIYRD